MVSSMLAPFTRFGGALRGRTVSEVNQERLQRPYGPAIAWYDLLTSYYRNNPYDIISAQAYKARHGLPRIIQPIYNPTKRAADWYAGHVYPSGYGTIPFEDGTAPEIEAAVNAAFVGWGNWDRLQSLYVKTGAILGNTMIELESDTESGRVYPIIRNPADVKDIELNYRGDVIAYTIEIPVYDDVTKQSFRWGRTVTRDSITTLRDGNPQGYDEQPATIPNPFPFVPAVWVPHTATGQPLGAPVIEGVIGKIDALNAMASSVHAYIGKFSRQGAVFATKESAASITPMFTKRGSTSELDNPYADDEEVRFFKGPPDLTVSRLIQNLGIGEAYQYMEKLIGEIGEDLPETTLDKDLRAMTGGVTGPGATRMTGDVVNRLAEAQRNYDWGLYRAAAMAVTMGAMLARAGVDGWARLTDTQRTFLEFDESSWDRGELDFQLADRPLLPETQAEKITNAAAIERLTTPSGLEMAGLSPKQIYGTNPQGEPNTPPQQIGLIAEQEEAARRQQTASILNFNAGGL